MCTGGVKPVSLPCSTPPHTPPATAGSPGSVIDEYCHKRLKWECLHPVPSEKGQPAAEIVPIRLLLSWTMLVHKPFGVLGASAGVLGASAGALGASAGVTGASAGVTGASACVIVSGTTVSCP